MKSKKLLLPTSILIAAMIAMAIFSVVSNIAKKPAIAEAEFPFSITYELNEKTETIDGVYVARYTGNGGYTSTTGRLYQGEIISQREDMDGSFVLSETPEGAIILYTEFSADYLMGDPLYDYFSDRDFAPTLVYYDHSENDSYTDEQTLLNHGVRLISWEYPEPIANAFVFSHISYLSSEAVIPLTLIAALALLAVLIFVKKDKTLGKQKRDVFSVICNFVIAIIAVPFFTICSIFSDINGSSPELEHQLLYLIPAITILGLAASVSLRRRGLRKSGFMVQFVGPVVFALLFLVSTIASSI